MKIAVLFQVKQECDDEKLANQLKEEYDASVRILRQQEERDAELARVEEERNREEERKKQEKEEAMRRLAEMQLKEEEAKLKLEQVQRKEVRRQKVEERKLAQLQLLEQMRNGEIEENYSSTESSSTQDNSENETSSSESETESEDSYQDTEVDHNAAEEEPDGTPQPHIEGENYVALSSDNEHDYVEISSDEEEMGTALSTTAPLNSRNPVNSEAGSPATSPEPDLLSEEFSGVAHSNKSSESVSKVPTSVRCTYEPDDSIIILNHSNEEVLSDCEASSGQSSNKQYGGVLLSIQHKSQEENSDDSDVDSGGNENDWIDVESCSSSEESSTPFNVLPSSNTFGTVSSTSGRREPISIHNANDENCELQ